VSTPEIFYWDGLLPVLQHFRAKSRSPGVRGFKRRNKVIVPAGRRNWTIEVPGSAHPDFSAFVLRWTGDSAIRSNSISETRLTNPRITLVYARRSVTYDAAAAHNVWHIPAPAASLLSGLLVWDAADKTPRADDHQPGRAVN